MEGHATLALIGMGASTATYLIGVAASKWPPSASLRHAITKRYGNVLNKASTMGSGRGAATTLHARHIGAFLCDADGAALQHCIGQFQRSRHRIYMRKLNISKSTSHMIDQYHSLTIQL